MNTKAPITTKISVYNMTPGTCFRIGTEEFVKLSDCIGDSIFNDENIGVRFAPLDSIRKEPVTLSILDHIAELIATETNQDIEEIFEWCLFDADPAISTKNSDIELECSFCYWNFPLDAIPVDRKIPEDLLEFIDEETEVFDFYE